MAARPEVFKAAAVSRPIAATHGSKIPILVQILHTGHHFVGVISDQFFVELGIPEPSFHLGIGGGSFRANTVRIMEEIERISLDQLPDAVLLCRGTDSTLAASKIKIPMMHVEAGLRSLNRQQPEEQNRVLTDHLAGLFLPPPTRPFAICRAGRHPCRADRAHG